MYKKELKHAREEIESHKKKIKSLEVVISKFAEIEGEFKSVKKWIIPSKLVIIIIIIFY